MIRVGIADDQELVRVGFKMLVDAQPDMTVVAEARDGAEAVDIARAHRPDVLLMDIRMPHVDGIAATAGITATAMSVKVLVLTTFDLDEYAFRALRAGASGFLIKDDPAVTLLAAIRSVAAGDAAVSARVTRRMLELFGAKLPGAPQATDDSLASLTHREREVLVLIGRGLSNGEIAGSTHTSESTVKTHVGRVLAKLSLRDRVHAVIFCYEHGLLDATER